MVEGIEVIVALTMTIVGLLFLAGGVAVWIEQWSKRERDRWSAARIEARRLEALRRLYEQWKL